MLFDTPSLSAMFPPSDSLVQHCKTSQTSGASLGASYIQSLIKKMSGGEEVFIREERKVFLLVDSTHPKSTEHPRDVYLPESVVQIRRNAK